MKATKLRMPGKTKGPSRRGSKRGTCPECSKKGMTQWRGEIVHGRAYLMSHCQYCAHSAVRELR